MSNIKIFQNTEFGQIRTLEINDEPYFVGKDIATILGYKDTVNAIKAHVDEEDKRGWQITTPSGNQQMTIVNESGLYSLILSSKLPAAKRFKHWVTSDVLPAIRKHGIYATDELVSNPDLLIKMATALKEEREQKAALQRENEEKDSQILQLSASVANMEKKVSYLDKIFACPSTVMVKTIAQDYGMSAIAFNLLLHDFGIQYRCGDVWILYAKYLPEGYVKDVPFEYTKSNGSKAIKSNMQWTQKGRSFLYHFLKERDVIPLIEKI